MNQKNKNLTHHLNQKASFTYYSNNTTSEKYNLCCKNIRFTCAKTCTVRDQITYLPILILISSSYLNQIMEKLVIFSFYWHRELFFSYSKKLKFSQNFSRTKIRKIVCFIQIVACMASVKKWKRVYFIRIVEIKYYTKIKSN